MKKYIALSFAIVFGFVALANAQVVPPAGVSCEDAIDGTCRHFDYGDGSEEGFDVMLPYPGDYGVCEVEDPISGIWCEFNDMNCPNPGTGVDGHNEPGVVECQGCDGEDSGSYSINEAKCCLYHGTPKGPNGETIC